MIYNNDLIYIEIEKSQIPWLKIFTHTPHKEFSECSSNEKEMIFKALDIIEKEMISYFNPAKINIASFGNMLPRVHWHIMARFESDDYFPNPIWGEKLRDGFILEKNIDKFIEIITKELESLQTTI